jgi:RNA polymerase sigma factor (sigma-70 family)
MGYLISRERPIVLGWPRRARSVSEIPRIAEDASEVTPADELLRRLVLRLQDGDQSALEELIRQTQQQAFRTAYAFLQDRQLTEDVLQDAYILVYQKIGQLQDPAAFRGWFRRIVVNRAQRVLKSRPTDWLDDERRPEVADDVREDHAVNDRLEIQQAFAQMKESERTVLALREVMDLSYEEIAQTLDVPLTTVKMRIFKARKRFLEFFQSPVRGGSKR